MHSAYSIGMFRAICQYTLACLFLVILKAHASEIQCESLFETPQPASNKKVARLFMAPPKISTEKPSLNIPKDLLDSKNVMAEAERELARRADFSALEARAFHVGFLAQQLPYVVKMLDLISPNDFSRTYFLFDLKGQRISGLSNVKSVIEHFKSQAHSALEMQNVTAEFFANYTMDILGLHYAMWKKLDFDKIEEFERYQGNLKATQNRPKRGSEYNDALEIVTQPMSPLIQFLNKVIEVKSKIRIQAADGILLWPTFSSLVSDDFQNWHLGVKPIGISLDHRLLFDGNVSDFFGLATHDVVNHIVPVEILKNKEHFSKFKNLFFQKISEQSNIQAEIIRKIWHLGTHEGAYAIYREYLKLRNGKYSVNQSVTNLEAELQASVISPEMGGNGFASLANQLKSELHFLGEVSPELQNMNLSEVQVEVARAWTGFLQIYRASTAAYFN